MNYKNDRIEAIRTARQWLGREPVYLDTETTGLNNTAEVCDIAVVNHDGEILLDTLVKPTKQIPAAATRIHGISNSDVAHAPSFVDILPQLADVLNGRFLLIHNASYDLRILEQSARLHDQDLYCHINYEDFYCAMELYAQFYGEWNDYHENYRWQKLADAARQCNIIFHARTLHRARADAEITRQVIQHIARTQVCKAKNLSKSV